MSDITKWTFTPDKYLCPTHTSVDLTVQVMRKVLACSDDTTDGAISYVRPECDEPVLGDFEVMVGCPGDSSMGDDEGKAHRQHLSGTLGMDRGGDEDDDDDGA